MTRSSSLRDPARAGPAAAAVASFALHAACGGRYGLFRDELYFLVCGERLGLGYVDQPPGIALVARAAHAAFGLWVPGLRLLPWLAASACAYAAGRLAAGLGAAPAAATLAAVATAAAPVLLALGHYLTMNAFEPLLWTALALAALRAVETDGARGGVAAGLAAGAGMLFKYSMAPFAACLVAGVLVGSSRQVLLRRGAVAGLAVALLLALPSLAWQAAHGLPFLELVRNGQLRKNEPFSLAGFARDAALMADPLAVPLAVGGLGWLLLGRGARRGRFLGVAALLELGILAAGRAKAYYVAPLLPALFAGGAAGLGVAARSRLAPAAAAAALAAAGLALAPMAVPLLAPERFVAYQARLGMAPSAGERHALGPLPQVFADQFGWPELAGAVAEAARRLSPGERARAVVYARNYGEASAIALLGAPLGAPPAVSGHNQFWLWGVPAGRGDVVLVVGDAGERCSGFRRQELALAVPDQPLAMPYERGRLVWICREPERPLSAVWPRLRQYL